VRNIGKTPIRFPGSQLLLSGHEELLPVAYTPLFITTPDHEHLLEVRISGTPSAPATAQHDASTSSPVTWRLSDTERLVLVVLGQRYLRHEAHPQPASWGQAAEELSELRPESRWTKKRLEHIVADVRDRLSRHGVKALTRDEVGEPVGNSLNHNLLIELLISTTLVPPDLYLLES
ncbi:MAG: FHA domain-containing protein, partial [Sciscionella sp.]